MEVFFSSEANREVGNRLHVISVRSQKICEKIISRTSLEDLDIEVRYIPIVMEKSVITNLQNRSRLHRNKRIYDHSPWLDFATFRDGSWPDQVRIFLDGLRTCATRLPELGAGSGQVQAFCDMLDQVEGRLNEEGPPSEERKVTVIPPSNRLPSKAEIARGFSAMRRKDAAVDRDTMRISDPARRIAGFRLTAESKTYLSDRYADAPLYYRNYRSGTESEDFRALGPASEDAAVRAVQEAAHRSVARLAAEFGLDPDATIARFADDRVSIGLGRDFRKAELRERAETRARRGEKPESRKESNAQIDAFHQQARMIFQEAILKVQDV